MSPGLRAATGLALVALVVALFFVFEEDAGDEGSGGSPPAATATTGGDDAMPEPTEPAQPPPPTIKVRGGEPVGGLRVLEFTQGERASFRVISDHVADLHVHGYDVGRALRPDRAVTVSFDADLEGAYEVELHGQETGEAAIAELRVSPG